MSVVRAGLSPLELTWPVATAIRGRLLASREAENGAVLRATVSGASSRLVREAGGASVQMTFEGCGQVSPGGWLVGLRAPGADAFVPAIGGATARRGPGGEGTGVLDAMVMTAAATGPDGQRVTYLDDAVLDAWFPVGASVCVAPVWQCTDFFDTRRQFARVDANGDGFIDADELRGLIASSGVCGALSEAEIDAEARAVMARADADGDGVIDYGEFCASGFDAARLRLRICELGAKAGRLCDAFHEAPPWRGRLPAATSSMAALLDGAPPLA